MSYLHVCLLPLRAKYKNKLQRALQATISAISKMSQKLSKVKKGLRHNSQLSLDKESFSWFSKVVICHLSSRFLQGEKGRDCTFINFTAIDVDTVSKKFFKSLVIFKNLVQKFKHCKHWASLKKEKEERKRKRGDGNRFWVIVLPPLFSQSQG